MHERNPAINRIWKILKIFENIEDEKHPATTHDIEIYLQRLCVKYKGAEDIELYELVNGLRLLAIEEQLTHEIVRSIVFHCIDIITKRG